eukprot:37554-Chlamydomonas_euryale.AAC.2
MRLAPGHHYTCVHVLDLPCSSSRSSSSGGGAGGIGGTAGGGTAGGTKAFVVLGSYLQYDAGFRAGLSSGLQLSQALLSVFEVTMQVRGAVTLHRCGGPRVHTLRQSQYLGGYAMGTVRMRMAQPCIHTSRGLLPCAAPSEGLFG